MLKIKNDFHIKFYSKELFSGLIILISSIILPHFLLSSIYSIYIYFEKAVEYWDVKYLIYASFYLIFFKTIKLFPIFFAIFLLVDSTEIYFKSKEKYYLKIFLAFILLQIVYFFMYKLYYKMDYYFDKVAVLEMIYLFFYFKKSFKSISFLKRTIVLFLIFFSIQWIDITKYFSILDYRTTGEIFFELRTIAFLLDASLLLDLVGILFFSILFIFSVALLYIFLDIEKTKAIYKNQKEIAFISSKLDMQEAENRYFKEIQYLVHDLKTPLFSINSLIEILTIQEKNTKKLEYFNKISNSLDRCNIMISEILRDSDKNLLKINKLFDFIFSYLSIHEVSNYIKFYNYCPDAQIRVNKILFSRAIINLILNSYDAINDKKNAKITLTAKNYIKFIILIIEDNGIGMGDNITNQILKNKKFSTKNSSGIGLNFVKTIISEHNGEIKVISEKNIGTKFYILLKKESNYENYEK